MKVKKFEIELEVKKLFEPLSRGSEILMVIFFPKRKILLHRKKYYPNGIYRLLSGGIKRGETLLQALKREVMEETGNEIEKAELKAKILYKIKSPRIEKKFCSYVFFVKLKGKRIKPMYSKEKICEFKKLKISRLIFITRKLERMGRKLKDWGRFRAIAHRIVFELIKDNNSYEIF